MTRNFKLENAYRTFHLKTSAPFWLVELAKKHFIFRCHPDNNPNSDPEEIIAYNQAFDLIAKNKTNSS